MEYARYVEAAQQAAQLFESGEHEKALKAFRDLIASDIADIDKSMMCCNVALVLQKLGREHEVLAAYDRGMAFERPHGRCFVAEHKAGYLHTLGRDAEALRLYEELLNRSSLTEGEKDRIRTNVTLLRERLG